MFAVDYKYIQINGIDNNKLFEESSKTWHNRLSDCETNTQYEDTLFNANGNEGKKLIDKIEQVSGMTIKDIWTHKHEPNEKTNVHNHGGNDYSFVYYVRVPKEAGKLVFQLNEHMPQHCMACNESTLYVFPSWVNHYVTKNKSNEIRLSISGNFNKR